MSGEDFSEFDDDDDTIHRCGVRWGSEDDPCFNMDVVPDDEKSYGKRK